MCHCINHLLLYNNIISQDEYTIKTSMMEEALCNVPATEEIVPLMKGELQ